MKKRIFSLFLLLTPLNLTASFAQTAKQVLDKCAAAVSARDGIQADFTMNSAQYGNASGHIAVKGKMFRAHTSVATLWFDGSSLWTYMANNDEVNVSHPSESQLQVMNPYNFIYMYKSGYSYTMTHTAKTFSVHLTASNAQKRVREMFITVDKATYHPQEVKLLQNQKWTTFTIKNLKKGHLKDSEFRFNSKDYPSAEVIDLR